ncbi:MAG: hypothetical protein ACI3Y2_06815 [Candidatus Egerieousia sp.]
MDNYKRLTDNIRRAAGVRTMAIYQGIVVSTDGITCSCRFDDLIVDGIRLRASLTKRERQMIVVPKPGSAVILGSLSGDLSQAVVLQVDEAEKIILNGGSLGGLVNIETLTAKINELVEAFNSHEHTIQTGMIKTAGSATSQSNVAPVTVPVVAQKAKKLRRQDYEDETIKH